MKCVVCSAAVGEPEFANAWEKARKLYPCCSAACAEKFDPDVHWLPSVQPPAASFPDEARLLRTARERIHAGDRPSIVVRDLLIGGVGIPGVRKLLVDAELEANASDATARKLNILGGIRALFGGGISMAERRSKQSVELLRAASADVEAWQRHFDIHTPSDPRPHLA